MNKINLFAIFTIVAAAAMFGGVISPAFAASHENATMTMDNMTSGMDNMTSGMDNMTMSMDENMTSLG